ncbi:C4_traR_proteo, phage/conjugal plasmid C-4 type zinc finger protein, TraR family [uncultured Caudovirales phage]|uniref:C4_traR_proteo, phage/conjugal plasmid C-4 type zinc finger protein, TraR family n=1 Tax=uncultured Caudovirales phage TaxID=2100421 RepID=A0A6J5PGY9_9CAUD|nr:C4_traR_proteo, phage/conjugal plasmid C-4 type zinc finger protein, TraR family [uncultured Caudovirales phage]
MSGYGSPDDEAIHAGILAENGIHAVRSRAYTGESAKICTECGESIPEARRLALVGVKCCIQCQQLKEKSE